MDNIIKIIVFLLIGMGLKHLPAFPKNTSQILTSFVIYVSLPAMVLKQIPNLPISSKILIPALMPWTMLLISAGLVLALSRIFRWEKSVTGALMLLVPLGNTSFLGIPMVDLYFGSDHIPYALVYDQLGTFLALGTYGAVIVIIVSKERAIDIKQIVYQIISFPPLIALILAFIFHSIQYPAPITVILDSLSATLIPLVIIAVGLKMEFQISREQVNPMLVGLSIKLVIAPLIALGIIHGFNLVSPAAEVSVFEAGMPPAISAWALAMSLGLSPKLGTMMVGIGMLLSFVTLTLLFQLL